MKTYKLKDYAGSQIEVYPNAVNTRLILRCEDPTVVGREARRPARLTKRKAIALGKALLRMAEGL